MNNMYDWYETPDTLYIVFYIKRELQHTFNYTIIGNELKSSYLNMKLPGIKKYNMQADDYKLTLEIKKTKIEKWDYLFNSNLHDINHSKKDRNSYYKNGMKNKNSNKHFDIDYEEEEDEEINIERFFTKLYANASDDVKKAIDKSLYESKGTVLTTCWNDVKDKRVEPVIEYEETKPYKGSDHNCNKS